MRPGISNEMLERAGVRHVSADEAKALCGLASSGLWLPYRNVDGSAIRDGDKDYGRLRLERPRGDMKYYQAGGTTVHAYLPPMVAAVTNVGGDLFIIEGEFKSLALAEAGFQAVGISGFFGFGSKDNGGLVPELAAVIEKHKPARILFCGDSDTALNCFFPLAAVRLANLVQPVPVLLPRIPLNGPGKGADDCRAKLNDTFADWWRERIANAIEVKPDTDSALLMTELVEFEQAAIISLNGKARKDVNDRLVKLAATFEQNALIQEQLLTFAEKKLGLKRRALNKAVKAALKKPKTESQPVPLEAFYDPARKCYWIPNTRREMIEITETSLQRHLANAGYSCEPEDGGTSPLADEIIRVQRERDVLYAGPLAGHVVGPQEMCGQRILVTRGPRLILPKPGECPTIEKLLLGLLDDPDPNINQITFLLGWLKIAYESLLHGQLRPGQALALAGPKDCGKSLLQNLITEMLGGRSAKPYRYMSGATEFNGDLFGAEHLMIEDEFANTDIRTRRNFGARIKDFTVNQVQSCHGKNRPAVSLKPFWRVSISLNEEPENLLILPPIDESLEDKLILLKASKALLPDDIGTSAGREKYWAQLMAELPMFLDLLVNFKIPAALHSGRFGVKHFQHPGLLAAVNEMSPEMRLMGLIDAALKEKKDHVGRWTGTATDLERMLNESAVAFEARRLLDWNNAMGTYLGRLAKKLPKRIRAERTNTTRTWVVVPAHWKLDDEPAPVAEPSLM
jgi:hypothetical protein